MCVEAGVGGCRERDFEVNLRDGVGCGCADASRGRVAAARGPGACECEGGWGQGGAVGRVTASAHPDFKTGDLVSSMLGWRTAWVAAPPLDRSLFAASSDIARSH